jgi:hypothetical protein
MENSEKIQALNWMTNMCRLAFLYPLESYRKRFVDSELKHWSIIETRLSEVAEKKNILYRSYNIVRTDKGVNYHNPLSVWMWVDANQRVIEKIPELRGVLRAAHAFEDGRAKRANIDRQDYISDESYEYFLEDSSREAWIQASLAFESGTPPASNTGGK